MHIFFHTRLLVSQSVFAKTENNFPCHLIYDMVCREEYQASKKTAQSQTEDSVPLRDGAWNAPSFQSFPMPPYLPLYSPEQDAN
jgi:hypothetical protein